MSNDLLDDFFDDVMRALPHGSGIDLDWSVVSHTDTQVVFSNSYHTMDEHGGYDGWLDFTVTYQYNATNEEIQRECPDCKGTGTAIYNFGNGEMTGQCTFCLGKGQLIFAPRSVKYDELNTDEKNWMLQTECGDCGGRHTWQCKTCRGVGGFSEDGEWFECEDCYATGEVVCAECNEEGLVEYDDLPSLLEYLDQTFWEEVKL